MSLIQPLQIESCTYMYVVLKYETYMKIRPIAEVPIPDGCHVYDGFQSPPFPARAPIPHQAAARRPTACRRSSCSNNHVVQHS